MKKFLSSCLRVWRYILCLATVLLILTLMVIVVSLPIYFRNQQKTYKTEYAKLEFSGTICESSKVQPGTFAILRPWDEVRTWGKEAILSYQIFNGLQCTAWTPNEKTPGTFLKSSHSFGPTTRWNFFTKCQTLFCPNTGEIVFEPKVMPLCDMYGLTLIILVLCLAIGGTIFGKRFFSALEVVLKPNLTNRPLLN